MQGLESSRETRLSPRETSEESVGIKYHPNVSVLYDDNTSVHDFYDLDSLDLRFLK